ncbi:MAG: tetratricopeptide repeat protein [bacterium]|nr:tetratricopeptide repeat protein [bacterium]
MLIIVKKGITKHMGKAVYRVSCSINEKHRFPLVLDIDNKETGEKDREEYCPFCDVIVPVSTGEKIRERIDSFSTGIEKFREIALPEINRELFLERLWDRASAEEQSLAEVLFYYEKPVTETAFLLQGFDENLHQALIRLNELTLVEVSIDTELELLYYSIPAVVRELFLKYDIFEEMSSEYHEIAGRYFYHREDVAAAFAHFHLAENKKKIYDLGEELSSVYITEQKLDDALHVCALVEEVFGSEVPWWSPNKMGLISFRTGRLDRALSNFRLAYDVLELLAEPEEKDLANKAEVLNNIGQVFTARGDYDSALENLEQSVSINRQLGDLNNEGVTLNNMGQVYTARGNYDLAIDCMEQSLAIRREIGDKSGEGVTLNNISRLHTTMGDHEKARESLEQSLALRKEIGDKKGQIPILHTLAMMEFKKKNILEMVTLEAEAFHLAEQLEDALGLFQSGRVLGSLLIARNRREEGIAILERALEAGRSIGISGTDKVEETLGDLKWEWGR